MSTVGKQQSESGSSVVAMTPYEAAKALVSALPSGMVHSVMLAANLTGGTVGGVVLDAEEAEGGYISEWDLADGATYLVLGVDVPTQIQGVVLLDELGVGE